MMTAPERRSRGSKRLADFVPAAHRRELDKLSKADLMEIVWDYAVRSVGAEDDTAAAYNDIAGVHATLVTALGGRRRLAIRAEAGR